MAYAAAGNGCSYRCFLGVGGRVGRRLAAQEAVVGLIARRRDRLDEVLADCRRSSPASAMWVADLGDTAAVGELALQAWDGLGGIDVLINNAAIPKRRAVTELRRTRWRTSCGSTSSPRCASRWPCCRGCSARGSGMIVNVSSVGGRLRIIHETAYCASKFALCGWSEAMAVDLYGTGVTVKLIEPGPVDTEIWDQPGSEEPALPGAEGGRRRSGRRHHRGHGRRPIRALRPGHEGGG